MSKYQVENDIEDHDLLTRIDQKVANLTREIDEIKNNHLNHIYKRLNKIETKIAYYAGAVIILLTIVNYLLK